MRQPNRALLVALAISVLIVIGGQVWADRRAASRHRSVEQRLVELTDRAASTERALQLIRLERVSGALGIRAVIDQIRHWAPQLQSASTPTAEIPRIQQKLGEILDATESLGSDAVGALRTALEQGADDEVRKWLILALARADQDVGQRTLVEVLRGVHASQPSARLRLFAADELLRRDRALAGQVLKEILEFESAQGITRPVPPHLRDSYEAVIGTNQFPEFFHFIGRLVQSQHPQTEEVLLMLLGRAEHDLLTYQECVKFLGQMRSRRAVGAIEKLFRSPPGRELNPFFQNHCLQALADIRGAEACAFFQEALRDTTIPVVVTKLQALVKQFCQ